MLKIFRVASVFLQNINIDLKKFSEFTELKGSQCSEVLRMWEELLIHTGRCQNLVIRSPASFINE